MIHYLYIYFETTLTSPKVKDLIHGPRREYKILIDSKHYSIGPDRSPGYSWNLLAQQAKYDIIFLTRIV
jgi:hypothetical protein